MNMNMNMIKYQSRRFEQDGAMYGVASHAPTEKITFFPSLSDHR